MRPRATVRIHDLLAGWCAPPSGEIHADAGLAERYRRLIEESSTDADIDLSVIAGRLHRSADHLAGLFRVACGCTPVAYRQRVRLAIAAELLSTSPLGVEAVARRCGFPSTAHFTRSFSRAYASSPRASAADDAAVILKRHAQVSFGQGAVERFEQRLPRLRRDSYPVRDARSATCSQAVT